MEQLVSIRPLEAIYEDIALTQTSLVELFVPENGEQQKNAFLANDIQNPTHIYDRLNGYNPEGRDRKLEELAQEISLHPGIPTKYKNLYQEYIDESRARNLLAASVAVIHSPESDEKEKTSAREAFMRLNVELFGEPDKASYDALLQETRVKLAIRPSDETSGKLWDELFEILPESSELAHAFEPSDATKEWITAAASQLYYRLLKHVPKRKQPFSPEDVANIFNEIIVEEFGESAVGWQAVVMKAKSTAVRAGEKRIIIPENRKPADYKQMRGLVAHELGVHMLRSVMGEETDLSLLRFGLAKNGDNEEGLAMIMQQAAQGGKFTNAGTMYPLIAGLMYHDNKDFRGCFEIMWRRKVLLDLKPNAAPTEKTIEDARIWAYAATNRITRGTDTLPWFKDLAYNNGWNSMWQHLEKISGDDLQLSLLLLGKSDPTVPAHRRALLETKSI